MRGISTSSIGIHIRLTVSMLPPWATMKGAKRCIGACRQR
jgi:hypothetical protein